MDPWQPCPVDTTDCISSSSSATNANVLGLHNEQDNPVQDQNSSDLPTNTKKSTENCNQFLDDFSFGDNFQPFVKLPDSQEYLESLEKKLKLIQKGGRKGANAESILRSLGQTKESCMIKLLSNSVEKLTIEGEIFEELKVNPLLKKLAPERQALTAEELVHLLKADQLEILLSNYSTDDEPSTVTAPDTTIATAAATSEPGELEKDVDTTESPSPALRSEETEASSRN